MSDYKYSFAFQSDSDDDSETCGPNCQGCAEGTELVQHYKNLQAEKKFSYALNPNYGGFQLWSWGEDEPCCKVFDCLKREHQELCPFVRSDPYVLAYVQLYRSKHISIEEGPEPRVVIFQEYDGIESIDRLATHTRMDLDRMRTELAIKAERSASKKDMIVASARALANKLLERTEDPESRTMVAQLLEMFKTVAKE